MSLPNYSRFTKTLAQAHRQPEASFEALCEMAGSIVGLKLFTVMTFDPESQLARRAYSNMPEAYPVSGTKQLNRTAWAQHVLEERRTFVANDIEGIAKVFDDHQFIRSLGCESVINVPVVAGGEILGTINCLHEAGFYTDEKVAAAEALKLPAAASFLLNQRKAQQGGR